MSGQHLVIKVPLTKEHVLIVEDDEQLRSILALHLEDAEYKISSARTGEKALYIKNNIVCKYLKNRC